MIKLRIAVRSFADFEAALAAHVRAYRDRNPSVEVEVARFGLPELHQALFEEEGLRQGTLDLAIFPTDWLGYASGAGVLECLSNWMERQPLPDWPEGWPASLRDPLETGCGFQCIPWHDGPECLIYRTDLFSDPGNRRTFAAKYGRELAPPITWHDFHETARFFTRSDGSRYGTLFAAYPDGHNTLYDLVLQVWSRGGEMYSADGQPALGGPEVVEAVDFYRNLVRDPLACYPGAERIDSIQSGDVFLSGKIAMMVNWFGFAARCNHPGSPLSGRIGLAPIPGGEPGQSASLSNYWVIGIASGSREKQAAYELLHHIAGPEMDKLTALSGAVGVRLSTWRDPDVRKRVPLYAELEKLSAHARTLPFCEQLPDFAEIVNQVSVEALQTDRPSEEILREAQDLALRKGISLNCDGDAGAE